MSKQLNPAAVGIFVAGALIISVVGLFILGAGGLFDKRGTFVVYFQSSANGLDEGSDVLLGGVKVGSVKKMMVQFDPETNAKVIPVVIELSADRIMALTGSPRYDRDSLFDEATIRMAIEEDGLRAKLMTKSALTGQLYVDLDFVRDEHESYVYPGETIDGLIQIPSMKNQIERVLESLSTSMNRLSKVDFGGLIEDVDSLVTSVEGKVGELDMQGISDRAKGTLDRADTTLGKIDELVSNEDLQAMLANLDAASGDLKGLMEGLDGDQVNVAVADAAEAMKAVKLAAANIAELTTPDAATAVRLNRTLTSISEASRSIEQLADYLKRNPGALISGKKAR